MPILSLTIIQLMSVEAQLEKIKEEIVEMHRNISEAGRPADLEQMQFKLAEYESVSATYNDLFRVILQDSIKMREGYAGAQKSADGTG